MSSSKLSFDGNKIYESEQIIYPGGLGKLLLVSTPNGLYEVTCETEVQAFLLFDEILKKGYVNFNKEYIFYDNNPNIKGKQEGVIIE